MDEAIETAAFAAGYMPERALRLSEKASDVYDDLVFLTNSAYNNEAPEPYVAFIIGGVFCGIAFLMWVMRLRKISQDVGNQMTNSLLARAMIAAYLDNDDALYTITKLAGESFVFLGALQLDYQLTFSVMLGFFTLVSAIDSLRVLIAFGETNSIADFVAASSRLAQKLKSRPVTQLKPTNVYEDLSREKFIVVMVFLTQVLLITFVVIDIYDTETHSCHDGTAGCPVVGTFGSWCFYILGIFMAVVFLLGPKTNFGQSEQNPSYWLKLLIAAKNSGAKCTWYDPVKDETITRVLTPTDPRLWMRFFMSFLINGVGFHILVHALPIQIAGQGSLTGVVFRAVGMLYLVDLDDTPGFMLTIVENKPEDAVSADKTEEKESSEEDLDTVGAAQAIIDEARAKLDELAAGQGLDNNTTPKMAMTGVLAGAAAGGIAARGLPMTSDKKKKEENADEGEGAGEGDVEEGEGGEADVADA